MSDDTDFCLLPDFEELRESLRKETLQKSKTESDAERARRVAHIVEQVWERSSLSIKAVGGPNDTVLFQAVSRPLLGS